MIEEKKSLIDAILSHNHYYARGMPIITDTEYDSLWKKLYTIDPTCQILYHTGQDPNLSENQRSHRHQIYGTNKAFSMEELKPFLTRFGHEELILEPKYDGCAAVFYKGLSDENKLILEGDGKVGRDISHHLSSVSVSFDPSSMESGELIFPLSKWQPSYGKNPRNTVAGWIGRDSFPESNVIEFVSHNNPRLYHYYTYDGNLDALCELLLYLYGIWSALYPLDGIMIKVSNEQTRLIAGNNGQSYSWSIAWKPPISTADTRVIDIEWNVSRSGRVIPTVLYEPISLCGTTNQRVTGNNAKWLLNKKISPGCLIKIGKAGEIIPKIISISNPKQKVSVIDSCPICNAPLSWSGLDLVCTGSSCISQFTKSVAYFYSDKGMDVKTIGEKRIFNLLEDQTLRNLLTEKPWALLDPRTYHSESFSLFDSIKAIWGEKITNNYLKELKEINKRKNAVHFISALGLPALAYKTAMKLFYYITEGKHYSSISQKSMRSFGEAYVTYFKAKKELRNFTFAPVPPLPSKLYCITGTLTQSRADMIEYLSAYGWQFTNNVTKTTDYLISGDSPGKTKTHNAKEKLIPIISETELITLLKGAKK